MPEDKDLNALLSAARKFVRSPADAIEDERRRHLDPQAQFETGLDRLERRIREDERRVQRQRRLVLALRAKESSSRLAEDLLHTFEDLLDQRRVLLMHLKEGQDRRYSHG